MSKSKLIQSKINAQEARIKQFEANEVLNEQNAKRLSSMKAYLEELQLELAKEIEVNNSEEVN